MDIHYFKENIEPKLKGFNVTYSYFPKGDFGELNRVYVEGKNKMGGIDFWSMGWMDVDIYDLSLDRQVMNLLLAPNDTETQEKTVEKFLRVFIDAK